MYASDNFKVNLIARQQWATPVESAIPEAQVGRFSDILFQKENKNTVDLLQEHEKSFFFLGRFLKGHS